MILCCIGAALRSRPVSLIVAMLLIWWSGAAVRPVLGTVTVETAGGSRYAGMVDSATDDDRLVLRTEGSRCYARRFLSWHVLVRAWQDEREIPLEELRASAPALASPPHSAWQANLPEPAGSEPPHAETSKAQTPAFIRVDSLVSNWNRNVLPDGLLLDLDVFDSTGQRIPAEGTLTVRLVGFRHGLAGGNRRFPELGRWVVQVGTQDFASSSAQFRLPFQALHPEEAMDLAATAMVHAVLAVPGVGTFEAVDNLVPIRPYAPLREELWQEQGTRYFSFEGTGRGRQFGQ